MITCELMGGIGNLMFQVAATEYLGYANNLDTFYYNTDKILTYLNAEDSHNPKLKHSFEYLDMFENFRWKIGVTGSVTNRVNVPFHYEKINPVDNTLYFGYFQTEKYFNDKAFIYNLFEPSSIVRDKLKKYDSVINSGVTCSIHVRRGDYIKYQAYHTVQPMDYFNQAIKRVGDVDQYIIFSDDIEWCKQNFKMENIFFVENERDYVEIFLQSMCNHNIISNSSFSWWGAWLNKHDNKIVVAPNKWFNTDAYNTVDIIPDSWIKI